MKSWIVIIFLLIANSAVAQVSFTNIQTFAIDITAPWALITVKTTSWYPRRRVDVSWSFRSDLWCGHQFRRPQRRRELTMRNFMKRISARVNWFPFPSRLPGAGKFFRCWSTESIPSTSSSLIMPLKVQTEFFTEGAWRILEENFQPYCPWTLAGIASPSAWPMATPGATPMMVGKNRKFRCTIFTPWILLIWVMRELCSGVLII